MNSPPYGQGPRQQFYGPTGQRNPAQCQNQTQGFGHSPFGTSGPNFPVSPGNWNTPPFTQPPPANAHTFNQPPPPCFSPQSQHCPPPRYGRPVNNVWGDPNLYRPNFGPPPRMCPPDARSQQHHGQFGPPGRGRGGCGRGRGGRGGGRGGGKNNQQNGNTNSNKNGNSSNHGQESKKAKTDKRDLPENNKFHCETCDRGFKTDEKYQQHILEHKKCTVDGCRYVAAPKLVDLHYHTVLLSEAPVSYNFKMWTKMSMPTGAAPATIRRKNNDSFRYTHLIENLKEVFDKHKNSVDFVKEALGGNTVYAVVFKTTGIVDGVRLSNQKILLEGHDLSRRTPTSCGGSEGVGGGSSGGGASIGHFRNTHGVGDVTGPHELMSSDVCQGDGYIASHPTSRGRMLGFGPSHPPPPPHPHDRGDAGGGRRGGGV